MLLIYIIWTVLLLVVSLLIFLRYKSGRSTLKTDDLVDNNESEELKTVLYSIGDAVITTDENGKIVRVNKIAEKLIGQTEEEVKGKDAKKVFTIVNENENLKYEDPIERVLADKQTIELSNSALLKSKTGLVTPISDSASPIINSNGKLEGVVLILRDETENRKKRKLLQESERKFSTVFHSSPEGIILTSIEGKFIDANTRFLEMTGYQRNDVVGKTTNDLSFWHKPDERKKLIDKIINENNKQKLEFDFRIKSGEIRKAYLSTELIEIGKDKVLLSIIQDITERKKAEQDLLIKKTALANINQAVFLIDMNQGFKYVNDAACNSLGYTKSELLNLKLSDIDPGFSDKNKYENLNLVKQNKLQKFETTHRKKNGETFPVEISSTYFSYEGEELVLSLAENISERKSAERERQIHLWILQSLDKISLTIQSHTELDKMMSAVLEEVLTIFDCDRAFLLFPCDPASDYWSVPMEKTRPEYPGVLALGEKIPMDENVAETLRVLIENDGSVKFGETYQNPLPTSAASRFGIKSILSMAIYPKAGKPWQFGLHQCSYSRIWTEDEERLFKEIGLRLADGLTSLLTFNSLKESEEKFRTLSENYPDFIVRFDSEGRHTYVNPSVERAFSNKLENIVGKTLMDLTPDSEVGNLELYNKVLETIKTKKSNSVETKWQTIDGERIIELRHIPEINEDGTCIGVLGIGRDITDRKNAELKLLEKDLHSNELLILSKKLELAATYNDVLDAAFNIVHKIIGYNNLWVYLISEDKKFAHILVAKGSVSKVLTSIPDYATLTIVGDAMLEEILSTDRIVLVEDARVDERTNKEIVAQIGNKTIVNVPIILLDRHLGSVGTGTFGDEGVKVPTQSQQEFLMALASHLAVSLDRVHLQSEKKEAVDRIRKLSAGIEQSPASVVITDMQGNVEYVNKRFTEVTGYSFDEVVGKHTRLLKSGDTSPEEYKKMWDTILNKKEWRGEFHNKKKNGELYWELASISPIVNEDGEVTSFLAVKEDITHIKKMTEELIAARNKAEEMNKVKSYFYAQMSHELRTPFVGIFGFADLLKDRLTEPEEKEMAEAIFKSSKRLMETLNKILDITKLEFDKLEPKITSFDLIQLIASLKENYQATSQKQNTLINTHFSTKPFYIKTDERLLREILENLISNAVKYTINGLIEIKVEKVVNENILFTSIKVIDNGIGIPSDKLEIIWDDFRQVSEGFNRSFEGTGLGLSITKKYVDLIGGKINVESKLNKGTTFILELPMDETQTEEPVEISYSKPDKFIGQSPDTLKKKILYVEDENITALYVTKVLSKIFDIETVDNAGKALELINNNYYSALILDINLKKGIDGLKLMQLIREVPYYKSIPIAALTAYASTGDKLEFLNKGFTHYLSKPFDSEDLFKLLENMLGK